MEVPATSAGTITEILVPVGQVVPVGAVVAVILAPGEVAASSPAAKSAVNPALAPVVASPASAPAPVVRAPVAVRRALDPFNAVHTPAHNFGPAALSNGIKVTQFARRQAAGPKTGRSHV